MRCGRELRETRGIDTQLTRQSDIGRPTKGFAPRTLNHYHGSIGPMKRRLRTATSPSARTIRGSALFVASAMLFCVVPSSASAQQPDGAGRDLVLSLLLPRPDGVAPDTSAFAEAPRPEPRWATLAANFMIPELPQVEYRAPIDPAPDQLSKMQAQISGWLPVPASIAPLLSVRNRLSNYSGRRVLRYVDPTLRGHASRLYSVGFSLSF